MKHGNGENVRIRILDERGVLQALAEHVRTSLVEEGVQRRASRATIEVEDDRIRGRVARRGDKNVMVILGRAGNVQVA